MQAHFGSSALKTDGLQFDFDQLKREYQNYEKWHPETARNEIYSQGFQETEVQSIINRLKQKTQWK